jgi:hypothetical protein
MLEGALVYPLMQSQKTYKTCLNKNTASSCEPTFFTAAESMRTCMKSKFKQSNVGGSIGSALYTKMPYLKQVVAAQTTAISTALDANNFADKVKAAFDSDRGEINSALLKPPAPLPPAGPQSAVITAIKPSAGDIEMSEIAPNAGVPIAAPATNSPSSTAAAPATNPPAAASSSASSATTASAVAENKYDPLLNPNPSDTLSTA